MKGVASKNSRENVFRGKITRNFSNMLPCEISGNFLAVGSCWYKCADFKILEVARVAREANFRALLLGRIKILVSERLSGPAAKSKILAQKHRFGGISDFSSPLAISTGGCP